MPDTRQKRAAKRLVHSVLTHSSAMGVIIALVSLAISLALAWNTTANDIVRVAWIALAFFCALYIFYAVYFKVSSKLAEKSFKELYLDNEEKDRLTSYNIYEIFTSFLNLRGLRLYGVKLYSETKISDIILAYTKIIYFKEISNSEILLSVTKSREIAYDIKYGKDRTDDEKIVAAQRFGDWEDDFRSYCKQQNIDYANCKNVLEIGFGTGLIYERGTLFEEIYRRNDGKKYITDISNDALGVARKRIPNPGCFHKKYKFIKCQAELLDSSIKDDSIDFYISLRVYSSSLFDIRRSLAEAKRVLHSGAPILLSIPHLYYNIETGSHEFGLMRDVREKKVTKSYRDDVVGDLIRYLKLFEFDNINYDSSFPYETYISARRGTVR